MNKFIVDTNIVLRILVYEESEQNLVTRKLLEKVNNEEIIFQIPNEVIIETVWVLESFYKLDRETISSSVKLLLESDGVESDPILIQAVTQYSTCKFDIVDCYLSCLSNATHTSILSWDKDFSKLNCESYSPHQMVTELK